MAIKPCADGDYLPSVLSSGRWNGQCYVPGMVRLLVGFNAASEGEAQKFLDGLRFLEPLTRLQTGCLACSNWLEPDLTLHHMEAWETEADIRYWLRTEAFRDLLEMVEAARDPTVQFDFVSTTRGLDYVAEVRGGFGTHRTNAGPRFEG